MCLWLPDAEKESWMIPIRSLLDVFERLNNKRDLSSAARTNKQENELIRKGLAAVISSTKLVYDWW